MQAGVREKRLERERHGARLPGQTPSSTIVWQKKEKKSRTLALALKKALELGPRRKRERLSFADRISTGGKREGSAHRSLSLYHGGEKSKARGASSLSTQKTGPAKADDPGARERMT